MNPDIRQLKTHLVQNLWGPDITKMPRWQAAFCYVLRLLYVTIRDLTDGQLNLRAMSLVYTTLLSLVPLLAVSFSVLKAFGVHNQLEPALLNLLAPLGERGAEITTRIINFVDNTQAGVLGSLGLVLLFYTVVSLMQKIERSFNYAWRVEQDRPFAQRFSDYLTVILLGPVLIVAALGITASIMSTNVVQAIAAIQPFGALLDLASRLTPYALIILAFTFVYLLMPNTRVRVLSAFVGASVAGVLWQTVGWAFTSFVVSSGKYMAIYSAFASLILFLIWLYLAWLILLVGANVAFYHQHPEHLRPERREYRLSIRLKERLALVFMRAIGANFYQDREPWTAERLAQHLNLPVETVLTVLHGLQAGGLITQTRDEPPHYLPAQPLETMAVERVLVSIRTADELSYPHNWVPHDVAVDELVAHVEHAVNEALGALTVKDLALADGAGPRPVEPVGSGEEADGRMQESA